MLSHHPRTLMRGAMPAASPAPMRGRLSAGRAADASDRAPSNLLLWYLGLIPHWTGATPPLRRHLLLRTHEWIVDRVLAPGATVGAAVSDLGPDGALERALAELVPPDEARSWRPFIQGVVANLRHALARPVTRRNEAWLRWLFLIPYSARLMAGPAAAPALAFPTGQEGTKASCTVTDSAPVRQVASV